MEGPECMNSNTFIIQSTIWNMVIESLISGLPISTNDHKKMSIDDCATHLWTHDDEERNQNVPIVDIAFHHESS